MSCSLFARGSTLSFFGGGSSLFFGEFGVLDKHVRVVHRVVVVVEFHDSSHEWIVGVVDLLNIAFVIVFDRNHHSFLKHVGRLDDAVCKQFPEVLHLLDSDELLVDLCACLDVRVPSALIDRVPDLLAAGAANILLLHFLVSLLVICHVLIFVVLALVLTELATRLLLARLSAAPPHLATVVALVHPAAPVVVFLFVVLLAAVLACFEATIELSLTLDKLLDSQLRFLLF